jgi:hypothetical protein
MKKMVKCDMCGREMRTAPGCDERFAYILLKGKIYERIRTSSNDVCQNGRCGDCGSTPGHLHHPECDMERCPRCGGQLISCGCAGNTMISEIIGTSFELEARRGFKPDIKPYKKGANPVFPYSNLKEGDILYGKVHPPKLYGRRK